MHIEENERNEDLSPLISVMEHLPAIDTRVRPDGEPHEFSNSGAINVQSSMPVNFSIS